MLIVCLFIEVFCGACLVGNTLLIMISICFDVCVAVLFANLLAILASLYSALYVLRVFSRPICMTYQWSVFSHQAAAAIFLSGIRDPSEYRIRLVIDASNHFLSLISRCSSLFM